MANYNFNGYTPEETEFDVNLNATGAYEEAVVALILDYVSTHAASFSAVKSYVVNENISPGV